MRTPSDKLSGDARVARIAHQLDTLLRLATDRAADHVIDGAPLAGDAHALEHRIAALLQRGHTGTPRERAHRLRAWARAHGRPDSSARPSVRQEQTVESLIRDHGLAAPIRADVADLLAGVDLSHLPKPPVAFTRLDLHLDRVTCQSTTRFDRDSDEPIAVALTFGPDGTVNAGPDIDLGTFSSGQSRAVNRVLANFSLADTPPLPTFGVVLALIEKDRGRGEPISETLDATGVTDAMLAALAVLLLALEVPLVEVPAAIAMVVFVALAGLAVVIVELALRDDMLGSRRSLFTVPLALLAPNATGASERLEYAGHGGRYSADIRWSLS